MRPPRLGFLGVGWIGRNRMEALAASGRAQVCAVSDTDAGLAASTGYPVLGPDELLAADLDGIVVATPSALHAAQSVAALRSGKAVFCQKPLGRDVGETTAVVDAARQADLLLGVDLSYRHLAATAALRQVLASGQLGEVYAADLVFHNAYGPDKPWFTDPALSGGGCVIDLGTHLVDLALHLLGSPDVQHVTSRLFSKGRATLADGSVVEDHAVARLDTSDGTAITLACSWFLHAGTPADISATFYGTKGSVALSNVDGSFYDFRATSRTGTTSEVLVEPPDDWGGRAAVQWAQRLGAGEGFDPACGELVHTASVLDRIYDR